MKILKYEPFAVNTFYSKNNKKNSPYTGSEITRSVTFHITSLSLRKSRYPISQKHEIEIKWFVLFFVLGFRVVWH